MESIRVLIVDDHLIVRQGIKMMIEVDPDIQIVGEAAEGQAAIRQVKKLNPDIVLMDIVMQGKDGITATAEIKQAYPAVKIIILTTYGEEHLTKAAMKAGADGFLLKDAEGEALLQAVKATYHRGLVSLDGRVAQRLFLTPENSKNSHKKLLTPREQEILELVARGLSNGSIAKALFVCEGTVKVHVSNILTKLKVSSRTEAAVLAVQQGLVPADGTTGKQD